MASYHLEAKIIGRSGGRSIIASVAYRTASEMTDAETGTRHDYTRKAGVADSFILTPDGSPAWARERASLWQAVQEKENRKNSQLAREIIVALPNELAPDDRADLLRGWLRDNLTSLGMVADVAIHDPEPDTPDAPRNPHAHILLTLRQLDPATADGWAKGKAREWNAPETLIGWRASWADHQNRALEKAGANARVDHRSLADQRADALAQGDELMAETLDRPPEPRMGMASAVVEKRAKRAGEAGPVTPQGRAVNDARNLRRRLKTAFQRAREAGHFLRSIARRKPEAQRPRSGPLAHIRRMIDDRREAVTRHDQPTAEPSDDSSPSPLD